MPNKRKGALQHDSDRPQWRRAENTLVQPHAKRDVPSHRERKIREMKAKARAEAKIG